MHFKLTMGCSGLTRRDFPHCSDHSRGILEDVKYTLTKKLELNCKWTDIGKQHYWMGHGPFPLLDSSKVRPVLKMQNILDLGKRSLFGFLDIKEIQVVCRCPPSSLFVARQDMTWQRLTQRHQVAGQGHRHCPLHSPAEFGPGKEFQLWVRWNTTLTCVKSTILNDVFVSMNYSKNPRVVAPWEKIYRDWKLACSSLVHLSSCSILQNRA